MKRNDHKREELLALGKEMRERRDRLIKEYKKRNPIPSRGRIITPELTELEQEEKTRFMQICDKYKD